MKRSYPVALRDQPVTDVAPLDVSRFPPSTFGDECAVEGHVTPVPYEHGISELEDDPVVVAATLIGALLGFVLSLLFPNGFQVLP